MAHSFGCMVVTEAGVNSNVSAVVDIVARAPDAGEDYTALANRFPTPPVALTHENGRLRSCAPSLSWMQPHTARRTASQIASASAASFLLRLT